ncbi:MAG: 6-bladed beta-propeller, partial [Gammaproteobacteria bacterium]
MQDSRVDSKIGFCAWVIVLALLAGCATTPQGASDEEDIRYWPPLPEQPRYLYEATLRGSRDIEQANQDALMAALIKGETLPDRRMGKPLALAVRAGRIYVTDSVMNLVHVFDLGRRRYFQMGVRFEGRLADPRGIWVGEQSRNVYVVDQGSKRVVVYDELGLYLRELSLADTVRPVDVAVDESRQRIYVLDGGGIDSDTHRVQVFSLEGHPIRTFGTRGREVGQF